MGTRRILIVGYDAHLLDGLAESVERYCLGCQVAVAKGGGDALRQFRECPFDLILTEHELPDMTGLELAHSVHRISPGTRIVLMVDTGSGHETRGAGQSELSPRDYVLKPVGIDQLWKAVYSLNLGEALNSA